MNKYTHRLRLSLQFFGDDDADHEEPEKKPKEPEKKPKEPEAGGNLGKIIQQLKKKLDESEKALAEANKRLAEQDEALAALMDGEPTPKRNSERFWGSLRNIKKRG